MSKTVITKRNPPVWASQNFLTSAAVIKRIVSLSSISKNDHVVEIGPGKGHITRELIQKCGRLTAIEIDREFYRRLSEKFRQTPGIHMVCYDFLKWDLPRTPYKVFANIPFNRTSEIIRKLTESSNPPEEAWLVVEKGAAKRFIGKPYETIHSLRLKPFFDCSLKYYFRREDFHPSPSVDAVLLHLKKKASPDIPWQNRLSFSRFITNGLSSQNGIHAVLTKRQISTAFKRANLPGEIPPSGEMSYVQWLCLFRCHIKYNKGHRQPKQ